MSRYSGFSVLLCIGRSGGWGIRRDGPGLRFHMGWVAIDFVARDLQRQMAVLGKIAAEALARRDKLPECTCGDDPKKHCSSCPPERAALRYT